MFLYVLFDEIENVSPKTEHEDAVKTFEPYIQWTKKNNADFTKLIGLIELQEEPSNVVFVF